MTEGTYPVEPAEPDPTPDEDAPGEDFVEGVDDEGAAAQTAPADDGLDEPTP